MAAVSRGIQDTTGYLCACKFARVIKQTFLGHEGNGDICVAMSRRNRNEYDTIFAVSVPLKYG